jgi:putative heme-binding domain-containing protein
VVGDDGALYFTIGGRGTESVLYRVVWTGEEPRAVTALPDGEAGAARALRRELEAFHGRIDPRAVEAAWPHLRSPDRAVRYAARLAIEAQPLASWRERAHGEREPRAACDALLALARHGAPESLGALLAAAARIEWAGADRELRLDLLRVLQLACIRMGAADAAQRRAWLARLEPLFPSGDDAIDGELVELLVFLDAPSVVARALPLLRERRVTPPPDWAGRLARNDRYGGTIRRLLDEPPPTGGMRYAWALRNVRYGWTPDQRAEFFAFLDAAAKHSGGESFRGYIDGMRDDALANCSAAERERFAPRAEDADAQPAEIVPARGPGRTWTVDAALAAVGDKLSGRDFDRGRELYRAAACASCHRFDGEGGSVGPDLSSVRARFSMRDLLEAIIEPSKIVSDQYAASVVETSSGDLLVGRVVEIDDATFEVRPGDPALPVQRVRRADVASTRRSEISPMPSALLNVLNPDELRDLIAYVLSGGNRSSPMFAK